MLIHLATNLKTAGRNTGRRPHRVGPLPHHGGPGLGRGRQQREERRLRVGARRLDLLGGQRRHRLLPGPRRYGRAEGHTGRAGQRPLHPDRGGQAQLDVHTERLGAGRLRLPRRERNRDDGSCNSTLVSSTKSLRCAVGRRLGLLGAATGLAALACGRGVSGVWVGRGTGCLACAGCGFPSAAGARARAGAAGADAAAGAGVAGAVAAAGCLVRMAARGRLARAARGGWRPGAGASTTRSGSNGEAVSASTVAPMLDGAFGRGIETPVVGRLTPPVPGRPSGLRLHGRERARRAIRAPAGLLHRSGTCSVQPREPASRTCSSAS